MAGDALFVDANVLVYASIASAPFHAEAQAVLEREWRQGAVLWVSRQVLRGFLAARSRPQTFAEPSSPTELAERVRFIEAYFRVADEDAAVTAHLLDLVQRYAVGGRQVHDANVVAKMQAHGIRRLMTHNVEDFRRFESEIEVEPLVSPELARGTRE